MSPLIQARLSHILLTSMYTSATAGERHLVHELDGRRTPWFWPQPGRVVYCGGWASTVTMRVGERSDDGGSQEHALRKHTWTDVYDTTLDGRPLLVGRIPVWEEFWSGSVPADLRSTISMEEADAYFDLLRRGIQQRPEALFATTPERRHPSILPERVTLMGSDIRATPPRRDMVPPVGPNGPFTPVIPSDIGDIYRPDITGAHGRSGGKNCWERICCVGLDIDKREVTAIVEILQSTGYGGALCSSTAFESVGFWLVEPSRAEREPNDWRDEPHPNPWSTLPGDACRGMVRFIGSKRIAVADIPRSEQGIVSCQDPLAQYSPSSLRYSVSVSLSDSDLDFMKSCSEVSPRLPVLHAVVAFNVDVTNEHFAGNGIAFGDWRSDVVQFPVLTSKGPTVEMAVGALHDECPTVRYTNLLRTLNGTSIDRLAIELTPRIVERIELHGGMKVVCLDASLQSRLGRRRRLAADVVEDRSVYYTRSSLPTDLVAREPFVLRPGTWLLCAVFGSESDHVDWDPDRDLVLVGNGPGVTTTCIGSVDEFKDASLTIASIDVALSFSDGDGHTFRNYRESEQYLHFPPCVDESTEIEELRFTSLVTSPQFRVFFPTNTGGNSPRNYVPAKGGPRIVVIAPANGSRPTYERLYQGYSNLAHQLCFQGAIVVLIGDWHPRSPFFLIDYLPYVLAEVDQLFSLPSTTPVFLFGHSQGGGGVARVLTDEDLPASDPRQKVRARVVGGLLLAPTFGGVELHMNVAPSLVIYGALDTDGPAFRVRCTKSTEFSRFLLSPVRLYQNARSAFNALLLVDGATHFRWIQAHDDVGKVSNFERERERNLILDESDDTGTVGRVFYFHDLILRSYATYFYRMLALNQPDYEQCFVNPEFQIPELSASTAPSKVVNQIHRYASSRLLTSLNRTGDARPSYRVRNMVVTRKVVADGVEQTLENRGLRATSTLDIDQSRSLPFFDLDLIFVEGRSIEVSFTITPGLRVTTADVLYAQVSVLSPDASLYDGKVDVRCEMTLGNGGKAAMPVMEESLRRRDVVLSPLYEPYGQTAKNLGDMHTIEEMHVPVAWFLQQCYGTVTDNGEATMTTLRLTITAGDRIRFGLGHLGILRLTNDGRMLS